jgi:hypothetical protein
VPYSAVGDKIGITRRQSDLPPDSTKSYGTGEGTNVHGAGTGTGAGAGDGAGTCAQTGTGNNPGCVGKSLNVNLQAQKRIRSDTGSDMSSKTGHGFPPVYHNVRKTREKANPYVELPTIEGNRRKLATCAKPGAGFDVVGDDRQHKVSNFHIPSFKKMLVQVSGGVMREYFVSHVMRNTALMVMTQYASSSLTRIFPHHYRRMMGDAALC